MTNHFCKCCNGHRPNNGVICLGCGSLLATCRRPEPKRTTSASCPECGKNSLHVQIEPGRFLCGNCSSVFERDDVGFFDDRPDVSLEKKERFEQMKKQRRNRR